MGETLYLAGYFLKSVRKNETKISTELAHHICSETNRQQCSLDINGYLAELL